MMLALIDVSVWRSQASQTGSSSSIPAIWKASGYPTRKYKRCLNTRTPSGPYTSSLDRATSWIFDRTGWAQRLSLRMAKHNSESADRFRQRTSVRNADDTLEAVDPSHFHGS